MSQRPGASRQVSPFVFTAIRHAHSLPAPRLMNQVRHSMTIAAFPSAMVYWFQNELLLLPGEHEYLSRTASPPA
jgi:hypothetical protein